MSKRVLTAMLAGLLLGGAATAGAALADATMSFRPDEVRITSDRAHSAVAVDGCVHLAEVGEPDLPVRILRFVIPADARVSDVSFTCADVVELPGSHVVMPAQPRVPTGAAEQWADGDAGIYASEAPYPRDRVRYLGEGFLAGHRIASVAVYPLQYEPANGRLLLARDVSVELSLEPAADLSVPRGRETVRSSETYRKLVSGLVENPEDLSPARVAQVPLSEEVDWFSPRYTPSLEGSAVEYVVITSEEFEPLFTTFAEWKTTLGVPTVVRTLPWIDENYHGVDAPERIRAFIKDAYESWGTSYVLLGGDTGIVPVRYVRSLYQGGELIPADIYYSSLEGNWNADGDDVFGEGYGGEFDPGDSTDLYPEVFVGRAPVGDIVELETFISKCQSYMGSPELHFTDRNLVLAEVLFPYDWESGPFSLDGATDVIEPIAHHFPGDLHVSKLYANHIDFPGSHELGAEVSIDSLDAGYNIAFHVGHGNKDILRVSKNNYVTMSDISSLTNSLAKSSFLWLLNCTTAAIDYDCIAERAINNSDGGAVGAFGATRLEFPATSRDYLWEWVDLLYNDDVVNVGETCAMAKAAFADPGVSGFENSQRWTQMTLLLLGDPQLPLWTSRARIMEVSHELFIEVGESEFTVTVTDGGPLEDALVTVMKNNDVYERGVTGPDGVATLTIRPDFTGTMSVAVTCQNHTPSESSVNVTPTPAPHLFLGAVGVDDDGFGESSGNGNGLAEAGETAELGIEVRNRGSVAADSISVVLSTLDPFVTITDCEEVVASVMPDDSRFLPEAFTLEIADTCPEEHDVVFNVELSGAERQVWNDELVVRVHRPELTLNILEVDDSAGDGDGTAEPGENVVLNVEIMNETTGQADAVTGVLSAPGGGATVIDDSESWGSVPGGEVRPGLTGFELVVGPDPAELLSLEITDEYGRVWTAALDLARPMAPDSLWGRVKSTTIELSWVPCGDADLRGYMVHRSLSPMGPFEQVSGGVIEGSSYFADSGLAENTLYHYYVMAVDTSGNLSEQTDVLAISTNPPSLSGWPLSTGGGMYASPAIVDLDGDGSPEIIVASEQIYAWHADGLEVRDGDGDPRTGGVFETDGTGGYRSSPAIGEIDGDTGVEIVAAAWADVGGTDAPVYEIFAWNAEDGSLVSGWPVTTRRFCWASPALADLDRDGRSEVVIACADGNLYCWKGDGTEFIDGDGEPSPDGVFAKLGGSWVYGSTAVADIDGDHVLDLIQPSSNDSVYAFRADGSRIPGWPVNVIARSMCSPAVGDVDGDGAPEVLVGSNSSKFWLLRADGTTVDGWPRTAPTGGDFPPSPILADVTGDGLLEAVIAGKDGRIVVCDHNGNDLPGWPIELGCDTYSSPVVADIDDDPDMEIAIGTNDGKVFAFDPDGELIAGWPILTGAEVIGAPAVCDLDGDGDNEVVVGGMDTNVYIWDCAGDYDEGEGVEWGSFLHDATRSQYHDFVMPTGVDDGTVETYARRLSLEQNSPNPFNPVTTIGFTVDAGDASDVDVRLDIYAVDGSLVRTLIDRPVSNGRHTVVWDGRDRGGDRVASGVYFYRLTHDGDADSRSMVLMK